MEWRDRRGLTSRVLANSVLLPGTNQFCKVKRFLSDRLTSRDFTFVWNRRLRNTYTYSFTMLVVSWFSCPDTRYCIFLQRLYRRCGFCPFWGRKNVFFRNKNIYDCKRQVNGTYMPNIKFLRQKLWQIKLVQTDRQTDTRTDRSMKTEGPIFVTSPCLAFFHLM